MCGILGGLTRDGGVFDEPTARAALGLLSHRGPDAEGVYTASGVFLGHRRLSIVDLDARANQPFRLGRRLITFNGEIYNHREIRRHLESRGHRFSTTSDTEVLLVAYAEYGRACLEMVEGMFAFAVWDENERRLFLARDRFGEKPLFYFHDENYFAFASEVGPLETVLPATALRESSDALALYFCLSYIPAPLGPYVNMHQLSPGAWLEFNVSSWTSKTGYHYRLNPQSAGDGREDYRAAQAQLAESLRASVELRMTTSDVPVATFLSGGVDSSVISSLASRAATAPISAYSVAFPEDPDFDESSYAQQLAKTLPSVRHEIIPVTERELLPFTQRTLESLSEPFADASLIPTAYLCSQVREKVILGGDGADELFGGYGVYAAMQWSARLPRWLKSILVQLPKSTNPQAIRNRALRGIALSHAHLRTEPLAEYFGWRMYSSSRDIEALGFNIDVLRALQGQFGQLKNGALRDIQCVDIAFNLPNDMLRKVDYASMFHSLEVRLPFLDSRLVHMAVSWPDKYKIDGGQRKRILKDTFSDLLPAAIRKRGKQGFLLPVRQWLRAGVLRERLREQVETQTRFDRAHLRARLSEHESGRYDHTEFLWMLYVYLQWVGSRRLRARR